MPMVAQYKGDASVRGWVMGDRIKNSTVWTVGRFIFRALIKVWLVLRALQRCG